MSSFTPDFPGHPNSDTHRAADTTERTGKLEILPHEPADQTPLFPLGNSLFAAGGDDSAEMPWEQSKGAAVKLDTKGPRIVD